MKTLDSDVDSAIAILNNKLATASKDISDVKELSVLASS